MHSPTIAIVFIGTALKGSYRVSTCIQAALWTIMYPVYESKPFQ